MTDYGRDVDEALLRVLRIGEQALVRVTGDGHWEDWMQIGDGLLALRQIAMRRAHTNIPTGRIYSAEFSELLNGSAYRQIDKAPRSYVIRCAENRAEIEAWRSKLDLRDRMAWSYPKTVWQKWQAHLAAEAERARIAAGGDDKQKKPSPVALLKEVNAELVRENDRLAKAAGAGSHFDLQSDTPRDIAKTIVGNSLAKARNIMRALSEAIKAEEARLKATENRNAGR